MDGNNDFPLPSLAPHLKLNRAPDAKGEPAWTLHNPVSNAYFKIDWVAFECLARFPLHKTAQALKEAVEAETTLKVSLDQIKGIVSFLHQNALMSLNDQTIRSQISAKTPFLKKAFHNYLYFSIPLFKPQKFLERTYPAVSPLFSAIFVKSMMVFLGLMILFTLPRIDEFFHTFTNIFSAQGMIGIFLVFAFVKIIHEFAHAYTAIRYGVQVPHMGIALIVMYPVLYTETTGSWQLSSRRARFHIGMAGIVAELCLAALFLVLWHISPSGSLGQTFAFMVVCVSLVSSLVVNLNPLMRFDGYYMFSDATGFDNLQTRSCAFARHALRETLFDLREKPPEDLSDKDQKFLTAFGFCLLIYRFFLFLGIAILVYHFFFQPLGFIMMLAELTWFIFLPILSELKIWWQKRKDIMTRKRSLIPAIILFGGFLILILPWKTTTTLPAILHAAQFQTIYAQAPSYISEISVKEGQSVSEGDILAVLESPELEKKSKMARQELKTLETLRRRAQSNPALVQNNELSDAALEKSRVNVEAYGKQQDLLIVRAPFDGVIKDMNTDIQQGRYIGIQEQLFTIINPQGTTVTAYATEDAREKIQSHSDAVFISDERDEEMRGLMIGRIADTGGDTVLWRELASVHGGPIPSDFDDMGAVKTRRTLYEVSATTDIQTLPVARRGYLKIETYRSSIFINIIKQLGALFRREGNVG